MYYRRALYPHDGQADVPDDLWAEFQRIRGHLSNIDQNNVDDRVIPRKNIQSHDDPDHNGASDTVSEIGDFLYKQVDVPPGTGIVDLVDYKGQWVDFGNKGLGLRAQSRGDAPWIVAASVDMTVLRNDGGPVDTGTLEWSSTSYNAENANVRLRIKSSQGGLSVAESVGGFNYWVGGCSLAVVASFLVRGGPVEFSPALYYRELYHSSSNSETPWKVHPFRMNIFAFGLYN